MWLTTTGMEAPCALLPPLPPRCCADRMTSSPGRFFKKVLILFALVPASHNIPSSFPVEGARAHVPYPPRPCTHCPQPTIHPATPARSLCLPPAFHNGFSQRHVPSAPPLRGALPNHPKKNHCAYASPPPLCLQPAPPLTAPTSLPMPSIAAPDADNRARNVSHPRCLPEHAGIWQGFFRYAFRGERRAFRFALASYVPSPRASLSPPLSTPVGVHPSVTRHNDVPATASVSPWSELRLRAGNLGGSYLLESNVPPQSRSSSPPPSLRP